MGWIKTNDGCIRNPDGSCWVKTNKGCWTHSDGRNVCKTGNGRWEKGGVGWEDSNSSEDDVPIGLFMEDDDGQEDDW